MHKHIGVLVHRLHRTGLVLLDPNSLGGDFFVVGVNAGFMTCPGDPDIKTAVCENLGHLLQRLVLLVIVAGFRSADQEHNLLLG